MARGEPSQTNPARLMLTGPGSVLFLIMAAMLVAAMNYRNNMAYFFCFLLFSLTLVSLVYGIQHLKAIEVVSIQPQPAFAGSTIRFELILSNRSSKRKGAFFFSSAALYRSGRFFGPFYLDAHSTTTAEIEIPVPRRGRFILSRVYLVTVYPLGFFRITKILKTRCEYIVYPKPDGLRQWPHEHPVESEGMEGFYSQGGDDFSGYRIYRDGESQRHIDWKAVARGRSMLIKEFSGGGMVQQWFSWSDLGGLGTEARLSQLTRWILDADRSDIEFGLEMPDSRHGPDSGTGFTRQCLKSLALFKSDEV